MVSHSPACTIVAPEMVVVMVMMVVMVVMVVVMVMGLMRLGAFIRVRSVTLR